MGIATHLSLRFIFDVAQPMAILPLYATLALGGIPLLVANGQKVRGFTSQAYESLFAGRR